MERGRSLGELGSRLLWSDLLAVIRHLPEDSHFRRALAAQVAEPGDAGGRKPAMTAAQARAAVKARMRKKKEED